LTSAFINYFFRSIYVIAGLLILFGVLEISPYDDEQANNNVRIAGGLILTLFGIYRIALYRIKSKKFNFSENSNSDNS